ncbi:MAG: hypothetical protein Q8J77_01100, partial [Methylotenera sp.]|nr:hypothetical protein [Methylotenera sp.]
MSTSKCTWSASPPNSINWQRRQARRKLGSSGWLKAKRKVARYQRYGADVRRDVAHKTSHTLST